jgi:hypothetical protein
MVSDAAAVTRPSRRRQGRARTHPSHAVVQAALLRKALHASMGAATVLMQLVSASWRAPSSVVLQLRNGLLQGILDCVRRYNQQSVSRAGQHARLLNMTQVSVYGCESSVRFYLGEESRGMNLSYAFVRERERTVLR